MSQIWEFFHQLPDKFAVCKLCEGKYSYKTSITNLKKHLGHKHDEIYQNMPTLLTAAPKKTEDESPDSLPADDVTWNFFERKDGYVRCVVCMGVLSDQAKHLYKHLKDKHPKLVADLPEQKAGDRTQANDDSDEDGDRYDSDETKEPPDHDEIYTEVVYLEESGVKDDARYPSAVHKHKLKDKKTILKRKSDLVTKVEKLKKSRRISASSDDKPETPKPAQQSSEDDLANFGRFVLSLLRKLPHRLANKLQMEIVYLIMNATVNYENSEEIGTSSTNKPCSITGNTVDNINSQVLDSSDAPSSCQRRDKDTGSVNVPSVAEAQNDPIANATSASNPRRNAIRKSLPEIISLSDKIPVSTFTPSSGRTPSRSSSSTAKCKDVDVGSGSEINATSIETQGIVNNTSVSNNEINPASEARDESVD